MATSDPNSRSESFPRLQQPSWPGIAPSTGLEEGAAATRPPQGISDRPELTDAETPTPSGVITPRPRARPIASPHAEEPRPIELPPLSVRLSSLPRWTPPPVEAAPWNDTVDAAAPHDDTLEMPPAAAPAPSSPDAGVELRAIGSYDVTEYIGDDAMGLVFTAEDRFLKRPVSLRILKRLLTSNESNWNLFLSETKATALLKDDRIATIYQIGEDRGHVYLAMELLKGESLEARLRRGPVSLATALWVVREAALGLSLAHQTGFVHRDINPTNLWLEIGADTGLLNDSLQKLRQGELPPEREAQYKRVKILDFGLARLLQQSDGRRRSAGFDTLAYVAPELADGGDGNARSDVFSLGVLFYRLLTDRLPYEGHTSKEALTGLMMKTAPQVMQLNPTLMPAVVQLVERMLSRDPMARPANAAEVARKIEAIGTPNRASGRRRTWLSVGVLIVALGIFGAGWVFLNRDRFGDGATVAEPPPPAKAALAPREALNAVGDHVTVEFIAGSMERVGDHIYIYEKPPDPKGLTFRVALPWHVVNEKRQRGAYWPDALFGAKLRVHGTVSREGRFSQVFVSDLEQFDEIVYGAGPAATRP